MSRKFTAVPVLCSTGTDSFVHINLAPHGDESPVSDYFTQEQIDKFIQSATNAVTDSVSDSLIKDLKLQLNIYYFEFESRGILKARLTSKAVNPKLYSGGRGGSTNEPRLEYDSVKKIFNIDYFKERIIRYVSDISKDAKKLNKLSKDFLDVDMPVYRAAKHLIYWIDTEKLGADPRKNPLGLDRRAYLKFRTYDNVRCNYFHNEDFLDDLNLLCDYADRKHMSDAELRKFAKDAVFYLSRRPRS